MVLIGMLHHRKHPQKIKKSLAYVAIASAEGAKLLYFTPKAVDFKRKRIFGYIYRNGSWKKKRSRFPDVIYNAGSPIKLERSIEVIEKLKEKIPFTTHSIGNKMRVYKRLTQHQKFQKFLIPSEYIYSVRAFLSYLRIYQKIVFKPVDGHKGEGIAFIEQIREEYRVLIGTKASMYSRSQLIEFVSSKLKEERHLVQPYINCKTKSGSSYDFRIHMQKNGNGEWVLLTTYPRIGAQGSIVANISSGGATNYLIPFLKQEFDEEYYNIKGYLEQFGLQLARHMDEIQDIHFNETIDELGIDVALDDMNRIWVFEVNWRPGCPPIFYLEMDVVKNSINYAIHLAKKKSIRKKINKE